MGNFHEIHPIKRAVVTGASGGVGHALVEKLLSEGVEVLALLHEGSVRNETIPRHALLHTESCSLEELERYGAVGDGGSGKGGDFSGGGLGYDVFFHLGWANTYKGLRGSLVAQQENVAYSCHAVELAHRLGCHTFLGAGSQAEYGRHDEALREDTLCVPDTAYGVMKLCSCHATRVLCRRHGMRHLWPRILSTYGLYDNTTSVLNSSIIKSLRGEKMSFTDGEQVWDFIYLDDVADALYEIARRGRDGSTYPIGSGQRHKLRDYLAILCRKLGYSGISGLGEIPREAGQVTHLEADISTLTADTGWRPKVDFETGIGIGIVIDYYRDWVAQHPAGGVASDGEDTGDAVQHASLRGVY